MKEQRRLAAIVSADVAGYSRLMGRDESGTLAALKELRREVVDPRIAKHTGRIVKTTGDGLLLEFASVVDAVRCVIEVQTVMAENTADTPEDRSIAFRIGVNIGDIIIDGDDIFGDGVNIAARLQEIAPPGGLCISGRAHDDVRDRLNASFADMGAQTLKNIARPIPVWRWFPHGPPAASTSPPTLALPDKPSIAVLPFQNMSGDPEQEYFADGIVEDIITALSRFKSLFVIARNSSFTYKGRAVDIKQVGRELGVRYVLEGSVRKAGGRVRITGQLIEAASNAHLWADRFEGPMDDVFTLQDKVTSSVVGIIEPTIQLSEIQRALVKPTGNLNAYDYYLRGVPNYNKWTREANEEAHRLFSAALELDPHYAAALIRLAAVHAQRWMQNWTDDRQREVIIGKSLQERALELAKEDQFVLAGSAYQHVQFGGDTATAVALMDRALNLNPNSSWALEMSTWIRIRAGDPELAVEHCLRAMRLNPFNQVNTPLAIAYFLLGREQEALASIDQALINAPRAHPTLLFAATIKVGFGRIEEARQLVKRVLEINPNTRATPGIWCPEKPEYKNKWTEARRALVPLGLSE
jgi:TolB-like protein/class 3 adenylate cyclase/tetratricopeptide (TPR) repeat protein